jgi:hypothetical protein
MKIKNEKIRNILNPRIVKRVPDNKLSSNTVCTVGGNYYNVFLKVYFVCRTLCSLNYIIYFYFPILKELVIYVSYCFFSINNRLLW